MREVGRSIASSEEEETSYVIAIVNLQEIFSAGLGNTLTLRLRYL
jgi:hypothetical protein